MYASNLLLTMAVLAVLIIVCLLPLFVDGTEDQGDGRTFVRIPGYVRTAPRIAREPGPSGPSRPRRACCSWAGGTRHRRGCT